MLRLLLVEPDDEAARRIETSFRHDDPHVSVYRVATLAAARRVFVEAPPAAVLAAHALPDGTSFDVLAALAAAQLRLPVVIVTAAAHDEVAIEVMKAGASDCLCREADERYAAALPGRLRDALRRHRDRREAEAQARAVEQHTLLATLHMTIASVKHEINNPLAIISGNAQLLSELSRVLDLDDEIVKPILDIEEASLRIAASLDKLNRIKEIIARETAAPEDVAGALPEVPPPVLRSRRVGTSSSRNGYN